MKIEGRARFQRAHLEEGVVVSSFAQSLDRSWTRPCPTRREVGEGLDGEELRIQTRGRTEKLESAWLLKKMKGGRGGELDLVVLVRDPSNRQLILDLGDPVLPKCETVDVEGVAFA